MVGNNAIADWIFAVFRANLGYQSRVIILNFALLFGNPSTVAMLLRVVARPSATSPGPGTTASSTVDGALAVSPSIASLCRDRLLMDEQSGGF